MTGCILVAIVNLIFTFGNHNVGNNKSALLNAFAAGFCIACILALSLS